MASNNHYQSTCQILLKKSDVLNFALQTNFVAFYSDGQKYFKVKVYGNLMHSLVHTNNSGKETFYNDNQIGFTEDINIINRRVITKNPFSGVNTNSTINMPNVKFNNPYTCQLLLKSSDVVKLKKIMQQKYTAKILSTGEIITVKPFLFDIKKPVGGVQFIIQSKYKYDNRNNLFNKLYYNVFEIKHQPSNILRSSLICKVSNLNFNTKYSNQITPNYIVPIYTIHRSPKQKNNTGYNTESTTNTASNSGSSL
jgi:hypothetical protein